MSTPETITPDLRTILRRLKLGRLDTLPERISLARGQKMGYDDFLVLVLGDEVSRRESLAATVRAQRAHLDPDMQLERWDDTAKVTFDRALLNELVSLRFIEQHRHVAIVGQVGVGKTQPTQHPVSIRELRRDGHGHRPNTPAARPDVPSCGDGPPAKDGSMLYGREAAECVWPHTYRIDKFCEIAETGAYFSTC